MKQVRYQDGIVIGGGVETHFPDVSFHVEKDSLTKKILASPTHSFIPPHYVTDGFGRKNQDCMDQPLLGGGSHLRSAYLQGAGALVCSWLYDKFRGKCSPFVGGGL